MASNRSGSSKDLVSFAKDHWVALSLIGLVALICLGLFLKHESIVSAGNEKQQDLAPLYKNRSIVLSDCVVKTRETADVAGANTKAVKEVVIGAVEGRYKIGSTAQPGGSKESFFSALVEAYPDGSAEQVSKTYQKVLVVINGCRTKFAHADEELQKHIASFHKWREGSFWNRKLGAKGFPTDALKITVEGKVLKGEDALEHMEEVVLIGEAREGVDSGEIDTLNPFEEESAE